MVVLWVMTPSKLVGKYQCFRGLCCPHLLNVKMETESSLKTLVSTQKTTWYNNPEYHRLNSHCCENIKSHISASHTYSRIHDHCLWSAWKLHSKSVFVLPVYLIKKIFLLNFTGNCSWQNSFNNRLYLKNWVCSCSPIGWSGKFGT